MQKPWTRSGASVCPNVPMACTHGQSKIIPITLCRRRTLRANVKRAPRDKTVQSVRLAHMHDSNSWCVVVCTLDYRAALTATSLTSLPRGCTEVQGSLNIMEYMFAASAKHERLYTANLTTYFARVERIRGHVSIIGNGNDSTNALYDLRSIDFLPNLKRIDGLGMRLKFVRTHPRSVRLCVSEVALCSFSVWRICMN
jgi:hypothetical protein